MGLQIKDVSSSDNFDMHYSVRLMDFTNFRTDVKIGDVVDEMERSRLVFRIFKEMFRKSASESEYLIREDDFYPTYQSVSDFTARGSMIFKPNAIMAIGNHISLLNNRLSNVDFVRHICNAEIAQIADAFEEIRNSKFEEFKLDLASFGALVHIPKRLLFYGKGPS